MVINVSDKVMVNMPKVMSGITHAQQMRKFNRKIATVTAVDGDGFRLNIDGGKYIWPIGVLGRIIPYGGEEPVMDFDIRQERGHYAVYFEDNFLCSSDTHREAEEDIEEYKREIEEVGFGKWKADFYIRRNKLKKLMS